MASKLIPEPGSDDPGEDAHRDRRCRPHSKDLSERVLPYELMPINLVRPLSDRLVWRLPGQLVWRLFHFAIPEGEPIATMSPPSIC